MASNFNILCILLHFREREREKKKIGEIREGERLNRRIDRWESGGITNSNSWSALNARNFKSSPFLLKLKGVGAQ